MSTPSDWRTSKKFLLLVRSEKSSQIAHSKPLARALGAHNRFPGVHRARFRCGACEKPAAAAAPTWPAVKEEEENRT
ncbi:hypothetical protein pipiens_003148 [Culex pipiens pipiens]|uniref:Uncharacterized protein n=1 Tax=Culex pipiens pipiens TaxID=38569 RepID=A0ABD1D2W3_CULPP